MFIHIGLIEFFICLTFDIVCNIGMTDNKYYKIYYISISFFILDFKIQTKTLDFRWPNSSK